MLTNFKLTIANFKFSLPADDSLCSDDLSDDEQGVTTESALSGDLFQQDVSTKF